MEERRGRYAPSPEELEKSLTGDESTEALAGEHVKDYIGRLMEMSYRGHKEIVGVHNGVEIVVPADSDPWNERLFQGLLGRWQAGMDERARQYGESPEGKRQAEELEKERIKLQEKTDRLLAELETLNFGDLEAVLNWLCEFQQPSDNSEIKKDVKKVIDAFEKAGFRAGAYVGEGESIMDDKEKAARYLVGQALDGLKDGGYINQVIHNFVEKWKVKHSSKDKKSK